MSRSEFASLRAIPERKFCHSGGRLPRRSAALQELGDADGEIVVATRSNDLDTNGNSSIGKPHRDGSDGYFERVPERRIGKVERTF